MADKSSRALLAAALSGLLAAHVAEHRPFSAWENHCLGAAFTLLRIGAYDRALHCLDDIGHPPAGFPTFALPRSLTPDDVQQAIALVSNNAPDATSSR
jgi:hypothetical protein